MLKFRKYGQFDASPELCRVRIGSHRLRMCGSQLIAVGGDETEEFHRQANMYVNAFSTQKRLIEMYTVPGVDHFDELNILADKDSEFFLKTVELIRSTVNAKK